MIEAEASTPIAAKGTGRPKLLHPPSSWLYIYHLEKGACIFQQRCGLCLPSILPGRLLCWNRQPSWKHWTGCAHCGHFGFGDILLVRIRSERAKCSKPFDGMVLFNKIVSISWRIGCASVFSQLWLWVTQGVSWGMVLWTHFFTFQPWNINISACRWSQKPVFGPKPMGGRWLNWLGDLGTTVLPLERLKTACLFVFYGIIFLLCICIIIWSYHGVRSRFLDQNQWEGVDCIDWETLARLVSLWSGWKWPVYIQGADIDPILNSKLSDIKNFWYSSRFLSHLPTDDSRQKCQSSRQPWPSSFRVCSR